MTTVDAKKQPIPADDAFKVLDGIDDLYAAKGKRVHHLDLRRSAPSRSVIAALLIGPSGNLRAPTVRKGRTLLVGFDEELYQRFVK